MPILKAQRKFTRKEYDYIKALIAELESRGMDIPPELLKKDVHRSWQKDLNGYFVKNDGTKYNPTAEQAGFVGDNSRFVGFVGGRGSGKSASGAQKAIKKIEAGENGAILNPDFENFKISTWPELRSWLPWDMVVDKHQYRKLESWQPTQPFQITFRNGVTVICKGLKNPDAARGPNINWLWYDEAQRDPDGMSWKIANASVRVGNEPQSWATYTPNGKLHWTYEFFEQQNIPEDALEIYEQMATGRDLIAAYHGSISDNKDNLSVDFYASMHSLYGHGWFKAQELDGEYVDQGGILGDVAWFNGKIIARPFEDPTGIVRYWDLAASEKKISGRNKNDPDETVGTKMSYFKKEDRYCVEHQISGHWEWEQILDVIVQTAKVDGVFVPIYVEQEPGSGGKNQVAAVANHVKNVFMEEGLPIPSVRPHNPRDNGDKVMRANIWFAEAKEGKIFLVNGSWVQGFLDQFGSFPEARHDDKVDSVSGARLCVSPIKKWKSIEYLAV